MDGHRQLNRTRKPQILIAHTWTKIFDMLNDLSHCAQITRGLKPSAKRKADGDARVRVLIWRVNVVAKGHIERHMQLNACRARGLKVHISKRDFLLGRK